MVPNELIKEILNLSLPDKEYVRDIVLASLAENLPPQLSPNDQQEILKRIKAYEKSPDTLIPWEEVKAKLAALRAGRNLFNGE